MFLEEYKKVKDVDNYEVSNLGNVRNSKTQRILKYSVSGYGYLKINLNNKDKRISKYIHKLVAETFIDNPEMKQYVDHINNDKLNNDIKNLRWVTKKENAQNSKLSSKNTSGIKGVFFNKERQNWKAAIKIDGINIHLGYFKSIEDAKNARIKKANEVFGEFKNICEN